MRRAFAAIFSASCLLAPMTVAAREFNFSKPAPNPPSLSSPGPTRIIPPPPQVAPRTPVVPASGTPQTAMPAASPAAVPTFEVITSQYDLPKGTQFNASAVRELVYNPSDTLAMTLQVADDVRDGSGDVVIPKGSTVWGSFRPVAAKEPEDPATASREPRDNSSWPEGSRFVAERVAIGDRIYNFKAQTEALPTQTDPRRNVGAEAGSGALIGAAGGAIVSIFTGGLGLIPILAGGGLGAGVGAAVASTPVVFIKGDQPLQLTLLEPLRVR